MARSTVLPIIYFVRELIDDEKTPYRFSDDQIQSALDRRIERHNRLGLYPAINADGMGQTVYTDWYGPVFMETADLTDQSYAAITPATRDLINGYYTFATDTRTVYVTGAEHDPYNVAADLLEREMARNGASFVDIKSGRHSIYNSQLRGHYDNLIMRYRKKAGKIPAIASLTSDSFASGNNLPGPDRKFYK